MHLDFFYSHILYIVYHNVRVLCYLIRSEKPVGSTYLRLLLLLIIDATRVSGCTATRENADRPHRMDATPDCLPQTEG